MIVEIETDRERDRRHGRQQKTPQDQLDWNVKCRRQVLDVYKEVFSDDINELGFLDGLPIRTQHGLKFYQNLEQQVRRVITYYKVSW